MDRRLLLLEASALVGALVLAEMGALFLELRTARILDWFVAMAPLLWVNASAAVLYLFWRGYTAAPGSRGPAARPSDRWIWPDFARLRTAARRRGFRPVWAGVGAAYGLLYMALQGMLIVDFSGGLPPVFAVLESPVGYGPGLAWSLAPSVGLLLRPYAVAALVALASFSGLLVALFAFSLWDRRRRARALSGPLAGLGVLCPACFTTPATGLVVGYVAPAAALVGLGTSSLFSLTLAVATALLLVSLAIMWVALAWLSRLP